MSDLEVAVAIVTYRSAAFTIDCLRSIEPERLTAGMRIRVIVVDNASGGQSRKIPGRPGSRW
jgi:GT2 family glycosyltransferase